MQRRQGRMLAAAGVKQRGQTPLQKGRSLVRQRVCMPEFESGALSCNNVRLSRLIERLMQGFHKFTVIE